MAERSKIKTDAEIPMAFSEFMCEVDALIRANAQETVIESDDLIQCSHTFGGLVDKGKSLFGFEFVADENYDENTGESIPWHFLITSDQIAGIANGTLKTLAMWRCEPDCGRRATVRNWYCTKCDYDAP